MFRLISNQTVLSTLAAAVVVTSFSITPAIAEGGGGGRDPNESFSSISSTNANGTKTSIRSRNGADTYTVFMLGPEVHDDHTAFRLL